MLINYQFLYFLLCCFVFKILSNSLRLKIPTFEQFNNKCSIETLLTSGLPDCEDNGTSSLKLVPPISHKISVWCIFIAMASKLSLNNRDWFQLSQARNANFLSYHSRSWINDKSKNKKLQGVIDKQKAVAIL